MDGGKRRKPAHIALAKDIGVAIVTGRYGVGSVLPGEIELAERSSVSRSVIRESLRMLSAKGLVESRPKAGTRVRERQAWNLLDPELLGWMFEGAPPVSFVRSLFQLRLIIEPAAAELAALKRTPAQLARIGHALEEMSVHGLGREIGRAADQTFHAVILEATDNELLVSLSASIAAAVRWTTYFKYSVPRMPRDAIAEHQALFNAIARGDPKAAREATVALVRQAQADTERAIDDEEARTSAAARQTRD